MSGRICVCVQINIGFKVALKCIVCHVEPPPGSGRNVFKRVSTLLAWTMMQSRLYSTTFFACALLMPA
jgi:hypothetical protein